MTNWMIDLPKESGDYLWICMWGCNCCERISGIAWIEELDSEDKERGDYLYQVDGKWLCIHWQSHARMPNSEQPLVPYIEKGIPDVDGYLKLDLPNQKNG